MATEFRHFKQLVLTMLSGLLCGATVAVTAAEARFPIHSFEVLGNTTIAENLIHKELAGYYGLAQEFSDLEAARMALQDLYVQHGYSAVKVTIPEQEVSGGTIIFQVTESRIGRVMVTGANFHDEENIRRTAPALSEGEVPNVVAIAESLRLANNNPSKKEHLVLKTSEQPDLIDALIKVDDKKTGVFFATLDNSGTPETGNSRLAIGYQDYNVLNRDHLLTLRLVMSPEEYEAVSILGVGYQIPLYQYADTLDLYAGYSNVDSGTVAGLFDVSGEGSVVGARYTHNFRKKSRYEDSLSLALERREYKNNIDFSGLPIGSDVNIQPLTLTYKGGLSKPRTEADFYLSAVRNIPGGESGGDTDFEKIRTGADSNYGLWRLGGNVTYTLPAGWVLRAVVNAQHSDEPLIPGEQFGLGGMASVRGFDERVVTGDRGWAASANIYTPDLARTQSLVERKLRLAMFVDGGEVNRVEPLPGEAERVRLGSVGVGVHYSQGKALTMRVEYGHVLNSAPIYGDGKLHASITLLF
jgi:hemolysin activation/secretion protein